MSKTKHPRAAALKIAESLIDRMRIYTQRIEIAGSIRREKDLVGDIELIAVPTVERDLFGKAFPETALDRYILMLNSRGSIQLIKNGEKYKQFTLTTLSGDLYQVDLFLQPDPATWGVNFIIRTGSATFSRKMVTPLSGGGYMPDPYRVRGARVVRRLSPTGDVEILETPEETDVFDLWGLDYIEPREREV